MSAGRSDAIVLFGASGDLAKKMTFVSLYRLAERGLLDMPIIGVAFTSWSDDDLRISGNEPGTSWSEDTWVGRVGDELVFLWIDGRYGSGDVFAVTLAPGDDSGWEPAPAG